ncbi:uncharacterized protein METZ01_LOCUS275186, partial [marine metagenome]
VKNNALYLALFFIAGLVFTSISVERVKDGFGGG